MHTKVTEGEKGGGQEMNRSILMHTVPRGLMVAVMIVFVATQAHTSKTSTSPEFIDTEESGPLKTQ